MQVTGKRQANDKRATGYHIGQPGSDGEATGRRQGSDRKTAGKPQEGNREATRNSDRRATGRNNRRATGERQEGVRQKVAWRHEKDRKRQEATGLRQEGGRIATGKQQASDRGATGERQESDRQATGEQQGAKSAKKVTQRGHGGDRTAIGERGGRNLIGVFPGGTAVLGCLARLALLQGQFWSTPERVPTMRV